MRVPSPTRRPVAWLMVALLPCWAAATDLAALPEFSRADVAMELIGIEYKLGNRASVAQIGAGNRVSIEQGAGNLNKVNVRQSGQDLTADLLQDGHGNNIHLVQQGSNQAASLSQYGNENQMYILQQGDVAQVAGQQIGDGNMLLLQQGSNTSFGFTQIGNQNQISAELPANNSWSYQVDQVGNNLRVQISPN